MKKSNAIRCLMTASLALMFVGVASASTITGIVVDDKGNAVSNIAVTAADLLDGSKVGTGRSDANGSFSLDSLAVGSYMVSADTLNTPWVQKTASPVVAIAEGTAPGAVKLVLVNLAMLSPASEARGNVVGILGVAASVGAILAGVQANETAKDARDASNKNSDQLRALGGNLDAITRRLQDMQNQISVLDRKSDEQAAELDKLLKQIEDISRRLFEIDQTVKEIHFSIFGK